MQRLLGFVLFALLAMPQGSAGETVALDGFFFLDVDKARKVWKAVQGGPVELAVPNPHEGPIGLRFPCPFSKLPDRCYWDADVRLDLSRYSAFSFSIHLEDPEATRRCTLYFRSGDGWYGAWFKVKRAGWQQVRLTRADFQAEGRPAGWHAIDGVRLSFWKAEPTDTAAQLSFLSGHVQDIVVVRGGRTIRQGSPEAQGVRRCATQVTKWLAEAGLDVGMLEDTDVEHGALEGCKIALLPYNPDLSEREATAIKSFVARGGRVLLAYNLPEQIAPVLGLRPGQWRKVNYPGEFATIRLSSKRLDGLPEEVPQGSWNATIPGLAGAEILGTWLDADGRDTGLPAVTWHENGVFFGHVLTNLDTERKSQMLVALIAGLRPDLKGEMGRQLLSGAERLLQLRTWEETAAFIGRQAIECGRLADAEPHLSTAARCRAYARAALEEGRFGDLLGRVGDMKASLRLAYYNSFVPRTPEFRGVWCHSAFGPPGMSWAAAIRRLKEHGFNAVVPNMLWAGRAYYPSDVLPTMPEVSKRGDQIALCLDACRRYGVALHVWKVNWNLQGAPKSFVERMRREGRLQRDTKGREVRWLCPSDDRNFRLERDSMTEVVRNYAVDGIHFDYIRYPNSSCCYCNGCRERFEKALGRKVAVWPDSVLSGPLRKDYLRWRRT